MRFPVELLQLSPEAAAFVTDLWTVIQYFDDLFDGDAYDGAEDIYDMLRILLVQFPSNPLFARHMAAIMPHLYLMIVKWRLSNQVEAAKQADARSFMWRAGFYDVVALVCFLDGKPIEPAYLMYGEKFDDYLQEVNNA